MLDPDRTTLVIAGNICYNIHFLFPSSIHSHDPKTYRNTLLQPYPSPKFQATVPNLPFDSIPNRITYHILFVSYPFPSQAN
ncbi:hypothetical protein VTL71DRAFT_15815 [Oculimacula yallundae]|uniref:Uncharacterized protein n=1 Tax=Oculimacula yallundae TaxID=86028 RepID=A0ABR4CCP4_9HELO